MEIRDIIEKVADTCKLHNVEHLDLFGSFATGTATSTSDIDFVVYGYDDYYSLLSDLDNIMTLRTIDIFDYYNIKNKDLLEDIKKYGKRIY